MAFDLALSPLNTGGACLDSSDSTELAIRIAELGLTDWRGYIPDKSDSSLGILSCKFNESSTYTNGWMDCGEPRSSVYNAGAGSWTYESMSLELP